MTTLTFRGSNFSYQPTRLSTTLDNNAVKYRGQEYTRHQAIATETGSKGLKFRGVAY